LKDQPEPGTPASGGRAKRELLAFAVILAIVLVVVLGRLWKSAVDRGGPGPAEPFRIAGNFYYVGADAVSAFLITGPEGHVVLDGGYPSTAPLIIASIAQLGFDIKDVKVLVNSIPRRDRAGGLAALQQASGAELWASEASAHTIATGGDDPDIAMPLRTLVQIGLLSYPPARVNHRFKDGDTLRVGPIALTAHITGGATRGCTSWSFPVRDGERVLNVVSACSFDVVRGMRYPEQRADIERSLRVLRSLPADIWVTSSSRSWGRYRKFVASQAAKHPVDAFIDPEGYRAYIDAAEAGFHGAQQPAEP
jgi:metallo-beta-lactamase class B